jgi:hypothetical protein
MAVVLGGIATVTRDVQPRNASSPMAVVLGGIAIATRDLQPLKAKLPMWGQPRGIEAVTRDSQRENAPSFQVPSSIVMHFSGSVTDTSAV